MEHADFLALVLTLAALMGCVNYLWIRLPETIGMLVCSLAFSLSVIGADRAFHLHIMSWFRATLDSAALSHIFLNLTLALLLFAGSLHVDVVQLTGRRWMILVLATASVVLSAVVFGAGMWAIFGLVGVAVPLVWCYLLGAIVAPTDAVVVEALLQRASIPARLRAVLVGESLFNDGAGVVLFLTTLRVAEGQATFTAHGQITLALLREISGGALVGLVVGCVAAFLVRRIADQGVQLMISLALAIGSYRLGTLLDVSGPIAVVVAGLCLRSQSPQFAPGSGTRSALVDFWSLFDRLLNAMLFLLIGLEILALAVGPLQILAAILALPLALAARILGVAPPASLGRETWRDKARTVAVLTWGGLRGGISVALALSLPDSPWRGTLILVAYAVVVFSIIVQGLTTPRLLRFVYRAATPG